MLKDGQLITCISIYSLTEPVAGLSYNERLLWGALVVKPSDSTEGAYERVGIVQGELNPKYECGWFEGIERSQITLV